MSESEKEAILERHMADLTMQQDAREQERRRQRDMLEVSVVNRDLQSAFRHSFNIPFLFVSCVAKARKAARHAGKEDEGRASGTG